MIKSCLPPLATALHQTIKTSKLVWFAHSGHGLFWEEKNKFNRDWSLSGNSLGNIYFRKNKKNEV
ncbi:hypothetical protein ACFSYB_08700 [Litchfieldia salsa]